MCKRLSRGSSYLPACYSRFAVVGIYTCRRVRGAQNMGLSRGRHNGCAGQIPAGAWSELHHLFKSTGLVVMEGMFRQDTGTLFKSFTVTPLFSLADFTEV